MELGLVLKTIIWFVVVALQLGALGLGVISFIIPSVPVIFGLSLLYGLIDGFQRLSWPTVLALAGLVAFDLIADNLASAFGAKRFGASRAGIIGAIVGGVVGIFIGPFGFILGPFLGAALGELFFNRTVREALRSGLGSALGVLASLLLKVAVGAALIGIFVWATWPPWCVAAC